MNPLARIKEKLMVKPNVEERERVAVVIKGVKKPRIQREPKTTVPATNEKGEEKEEGETDTDEPEKTVPVIVDETKNGFDRLALFKKLAESKKLMVSIKPVFKETEERKTAEPIPLPATTKKVKKVGIIDRPLIIEEDDEGVEPPVVEDITEADEFVMEPKTQAITIQPPKRKKRLTEKVEKGVAILGPESFVEIGTTPLSQRLPRKAPPVIIKVSSYYMNNREIFVNFINSIFEPYRKELDEDKEGISCDAIGKTSTSFSLLTHQKIVRDYMNLYTPYRGLLLYHGLGSGKTCTSIAIAEGMKDSKRVIILTPASLRANYIEELKKCGDLLYKRNQCWEWVSTDDKPGVLKTMSAILNLPQEYIEKHGGAFFIDISKPPNYDKLNDVKRKVLEEQLNEMIRQKYTFINYNGLRSRRLSEMTSGFTKNIFDNAVVIIDEAHNLISRIVNKLKKEKPVPE